MLTKDLEVRHCRVLVAVCDEGGVGAAARVLGVAQSTVSETLLSLERLLGAPVTVRRTGQSAVLTETAKALLPHARKLIAVAEAALAASALSNRVKIRLGTVESISSFLLPQAVSEFRLTWPQIDLDIMIGLCDDLRSRVAISELDVALTIEDSGRLYDRDMVENLWTTQLRMIVAPGHLLASRVVERSDLQNRVCVLADPEGAFNILMKSWLGGLARAPRLESAGSIEGVKRAVLNGDAIGILPDYAVTADLSAGTLVALETTEPLPAISARLTVQNLSQIEPPVQNLLAKIRETFSAQYA